MEKILLAVGFRQLEDFLEKNLKKEFLFVGTTVYREGIIRAIGQKNPDIVVIRETLDGKENILSIVYEIRNKFPKKRIVFIAGKREPGDALLATLVNYGVYDILQGEKVRAQEIVALIRKPNEYKDVQHLQPVPVLDERKNEVLFQAPTTVVQEKEIIKEIYIDSSKTVKETTPQNEPPVLVKPDVPVEVPVAEVMEPVKEEKDKVESVQEVPPQKKRVKESPPEPPKEPAKQKEPPREATKKSFLDKLKTKSDISSSLGQKMVATTKQKIITFIGSKSGVGNSSIAFNTALSLARKGLRTIFVEFDDKTPSVSYWYELGHLENGIDSALIALENNQFEKVEEAVIKSEDLKQAESLMQKNYRKFPSTLDFLFFSKKYLTRQSGDEIENRVNLSLSKELFLYLMFQLDYDFIILDVPQDVNHEVTHNALIYSNKVLLTLTQDVSTIGYSIYKLNEVAKKGINLDKKLYYIINKFEKSDLSLKEIEDWIQVSNLTTVPLFNKEFINANFLGLPVTLYSKNSSLQTAFQKIEKLIV
ncbi:ParA family protein (plasmid) [Aneurinibacillus sp. Ricciae_BoGa-3]|uniref:AAA family ATPase n=1 Tax=Aneurinibacillus sp. Ricciae_BoGa-3 TaxID=3022697 RepID=UPI0023423DC5|nr:ParA family protein [Aneurinibacillus sp. Ricciae_BoGa-3]WCK56923.1 ParA family protein [Aneurinibacillus sp. Ricciae_BoGa-3]WCK57746.1 ParA family protein [Aneurinibacillus sp. Ricciae_BoGa-3]